MIEFFKKHNAIRADDGGPRWRTATDENLLAWFNRHWPIAKYGDNREAGREATPAERVASLALFSEMAAEIKRRAVLPDASPGIIAAYFVHVLPLADKNV